jgi:tripartite-type tricarboxylate transporter receptor subunit TctC
MKVLKIGVVAAVLCAAASVCVAQQYPQRDVRIIVPQTTGGATDLLARLFAEKLSQRWGRSVFVENKAGAGGIIGVQSVATAPNDGYTLLMSSDGPQAINASLYKSLPYDPIKDFTPIATIGSVAFLIATNNQLGVSDFPALVKLAQSKPGLTFGSAGTGSLNHLIGEMINQATDMKLEHVPYKGAAPALTDLLGNHVSTVVASVPSIVQQVDNGSLKALAVTSAARSQRLPNLPTISELGYPQFGVSPWVGLLGPGNMPADVVAKISADVTLILKDPAVIAKILSIGMEPLTTTPKQFKTLLVQDIEKWSRVVKKANIAAQ